MGVSAHHTCYRIQVMSSNVKFSWQVTKALPSRWLIWAVEWAPAKVTVTSPSLPVLFSPISCLARKCKAQSFCETRHVDITRGPLALGGFIGNTGKEKLHRAGLLTEGSPAVKRGRWCIFSSGWILSTVEIMAPWFVCLFLFFSLGGRGRWRKCHFFVIES